jgi:hypothetical protein
LYSPVARAAAVLQEMMSKVTFSTLVMATILQPSPGDPSPRFPVKVTIPVNDEEVFDKAREETRTKNPL